MAAAVTANTISVTRTAQGDFETASSDLTSIGNSIAEARMTLTNQAMVSESGAQFGVAVDQWMDSFNDIQRTLQWMAQALGDTAQQIQNNEANNADLASGLSQQALPTF